MECLDEARKSFGTDEDILLVLSFSEVYVFILFVSCLKSCHLHYCFKGVSTICDTLCLTISVERWDRECASKILAICLYYNVAIEAWKHRYCLFEPQEGALDCIELTNRR